MRAWLGVLGLGVVAWHIPFVVAVLPFPLHPSQRPLFESIIYAIVRL